MRTAPILASILFALTGAAATTASDSTTAPLDDTPVAGLSFDDRLACESAIQHVYWQNREWPAANPEPRPSFEATIPQAAILAATEDSLLRSSALEKFWRRPITAEMLQAELDRIGRDTQRPDVLRQIHSALGHDPALLAECLARPLLAERLLRERYVSDDRLHAVERRRAFDELAIARRPEDLRATSGSYRELVVERDRRFAPDAKDPVTSLPGEGERGETERIWRRTRDWLADLFGTRGVDGRDPTAPPRAGELPAAGRISRLQEDDTRFYAVAVLAAGEERLELAVVEWPKQPFERWWHQVRGRFGAPGSPAPFPYRIDSPTGFACDADSWQPTITPVVDSYWATAVWTGSEMLVWGGFPFPEDHGNYGGRYDPATDTWRLIATWNAPAHRGRHSAVWTGTEMIVWGGESEGLLLTNTGGRYDPATNTWSSTALAGAPAPRNFHTAVWTGNEMVVWGGCTDGLCDVLPATGGRYDPATDSWSAVATGAAPSGRYLHTAVWTGDQMIVWGGWTGSAVTATGGRYDPAADSWTATATASAPSPRFTHSAIWAGDRMIVWGGRQGEFSSVYFDTGGTYDPLANIWTATSTTGAPSARDGHRAVWTGGEMIVFGGYDGNDEVNSGGRYDPLLDSWSATALLDAPTPRTIPNLVWTGTEMIAWAGIGSTGGGSGDGARYSPATDSWTPVGLPDTPSERDFHTHVWTGTEVVVWGGCGVFSPDLCPTDTGGRYDLVTDSWTPTSVVGTPTRREFQNAVWTGAEMILWGGCGDVFCFERFNTGGRYDPATDSWAPMSDVGAPIKRYWHDGVWTGTEMIVWGGCANKDCTDTAPPALPQVGGRYDPATDSWTLTSAVGAPSGRWFTTTTWDGDEMIVWGGQDMIDGRLDTGGRYDPATDSWTPTTTTGAPTPRVRHRSHWTGNRLLVWGGDDFFGTFYDVGGLYDPATDSWTPTTATAAPSARSYPYTAWTGSELVVWGGLPVDAGGGLYDPAADSWRPMTPAEAPTVRADLYTGAWTGNEMVLFGGAFPDTLNEAATGGVYCVGASAASFQILPTPAQQTICAGDSAEVGIEVPSFDGFSEPVTLALSGQPAGTTHGFSVNPVTPPGSSLLTLAGTAGVAPGTYTLTITGTSAPSGIVHDGTSNLTILSATLDAPALVSPTDGASGIGISPLLVWTASAGASLYRVEVDDDADFSSPEFTADVTTTSVAASGLGFDVHYFWRVSAESDCATAISTVFEFTTALFLDGFESGDTSAWSSVLP